MAMNDTEIISSLQKIVDSVGVGAFANHARANALVSDYFSGNDNAKTRKLIKSIIDVDAFAKISSASNSDLDGVCKAVKTLLADDESLSEDRAEMAVGWVCGALGKRKPNFPKPIQPKPQPIQSTSSGNSGSYSGHQSSFNSSYSPTRQPDQQSRTVNTRSNNTYGLNLNHHVKRKKKVPKKLIGWSITLCVLAALAYFVVWPKMIYPNMANEDLYTPEIVQTYSGSYSTGNVEGEAVVTILSCDNVGNVVGYFEFIVDNTYGKYEVSGKISEKKNNGNLVFILKSGQWLVQPDNYTPLETMTVEISNHYQKFECDQYGINWSMGVDDSNSIKTADDLRKLSNSNGVFQLKNDIDLAGKDWTPITGFSGTLLGNGYSIKNLTIHTSGSNVGLFDSVSGSISNLKLENVDIEVQGGYENIGAICGSTSGSINGCEVTGSIKATKCTNVGGIVGQVSSKNGGISDCKNVASVEGLDNVGGVAGHIYTMFSFAFISNENTGTVSGNNYVGGLLGCVAPKSVGWTEMSGDNYGDLVIKKCVNNGKVIGNDYVGGMAGSFSGTSTHLGFGDYYTITSSMSDNTNNATIAGRDYVGGLAGYTGGSANSISNCYNNADITGNYYVGGYVGYSSRAEITDAENKNKVSGKAYVGGIVGVGYSLKNCTNNGSVESTGTFLSETTLLSCTGGIAGQANFVHGCVNNKDVIVETNGYYVGGIVGIIKSDAIINMDGNKNYGNVAGYSYVGGFAGAISSQPGPGDINYYEGTLIISNVLNSGNISASAEYAGGITGYVEGAYRHYGFGDCKNVTYQISFCNNTGDVSGTANVDGIAGKVGEYVVTDETVLNTNESIGTITIK